MCAGLADHLGWSVLVLRVVAVVLGATGLVGVAVYFALWLVMPRSAEQRSAPGLEANTRKGLRPRGSVTLSPVDLGMASALGLLGIGLLWLLQASGFALPTWVLLSGLLAAIGLGLIWWQADHLSTKELRHGSGWRRLLAPLMAHWTTLVAIGIGLLALAAAVAVLVVAQPTLGEVARTLLVVGLAVVALVLAVLPWILSVRHALAQARDDALVADARADMAAHLHDSVLQTLALIQRKAADPKAVTALARRQERELRQWLYGESLGSATLAEALSAEIIDVEDRHGVDVELVSRRRLRTDPGGDGRGEGRPRGDGERGQALRRRPDRRLRRGRSRPLSSVYVRDRGSGFDLADVEEDRMGVRGSIVERVKRVGGRAIIRTAPGEGTEVQTGDAAMTEAETPTDPRCLAGGARRRPRHVPQRRAPRHRRPGARWSARARTCRRPWPRSSPRSPDVVLLDVHLPGGGGVEVIKQVTAVEPEVKFLALSVSDAAEDVIGVIRAGARGYVTKSISADELVEAIGRVAEGDAVFSPRLAGFVLDAFSGAIDVASIDEDLDRLSISGARGAAADRPRVRLQGDRPRAVHLDQDRRDPRLQRAAQAPAVEPPPAHPLGDRPQAAC